MKGKEQVVIVNESDEIVGSADREEMRRRNLIHRASYILVFNSAEEIFVHKRTMSKDIYPGFYDIAAGGVVQAGESYEESAVRELYEELGICRAEMRQHFDIYFEEENNRVFGRIFSCTHDGDIRLQMEEIESGEFFPVEKCLHMMTIENFTPDSEIVLRRLLNEKRQEQPR